MSKLILRLPKLIKLNHLISFSKYSTNNDNNNSYFTSHHTNHQSQAHDSKTEIIYEKISNETLETLAEKFDEIGENNLNDEEAKDYDVSFSNGVLTVKFSPKIGTYVLNKQTPNLQIWLSSPMSGPKRFDLSENKKWVYKRTGESLLQLLNEEISKCVGKPVRFD